MLFLTSINSSLPPAILLGGGANALSAARSLRRQGIAVYSLGNVPDVAFSRCCVRIPTPVGGNIQQQWYVWLDDTGRKKFKGAAIIPCGDDGLEFVARNRVAFGEDFLIYEANDDVLLAMLDKAASYKLAKNVGVPGPETWVVNTHEDLLTVLNSVKYPCGLKPRVSHEFKKYFPQKLFVANDANELTAAFEKVNRFNLEMIVTELIPGGDNGYCSYYTYLDERGEPLFHFTKRKLRQYPNGFGFGTYHLTDWNPEVAKLGLQYFQGIGLRGLANVEFKRDPRDSKLKLIECNHRFTEANEQVMIAGLDLALLVYNRLTGRPLPRLDSYRRNVALAKPWQDVLAFHGLFRRGEISLGEWLKSIAHVPHLLYFKWWDPMPSFHQSYLFLKRQVGKVTARFESRVSSATTILATNKATR
ncbi:MAG: carboxylate--amine ligase [Ignavibacteriae bacterium]|nr:carboxylate--amine ligase [Ignavibacteriota bacterium]